LVKIFVSFCYLGHAAVEDAEAQEWRAEEETAAQAVGGGVREDAEQAVDGAEQGCRGMAEGCRGTAAYGTGGEVFADALYGFA
jgi:hypothetical protein